MSKTENLNDREREYGQVYITDLYNNNAFKKRKLENKETDSHVTPSESPDHLKQADPSLFQQPEDKRKRKRTKDVSECSPPTTPRFETKCGKAISPSSLPKSPSSSLSFPSSASPKHLAHVSEFVCGSCHSHLKDCCLQNIFVAAASQSENKSRKVIQKLTYDE